MDRWVLRGCLCLTVGLFVLGVAGCSDDDPVAPGDPDRRTMSVSVLDRGDCQECEFLIAFTSNLDGTLLDYSLTTGTAEFELEIPTALGEGFYLTRFQQYGPSRTLFTNYYIVIDNLVVEWQMGFADLPRQNTSLRFSNIPAHQGYQIGTGRSSYLGSVLTDQLDLSLIESPVDVLTVVDLMDESQAYLWQNGVEAGSEYSIDLDDLVTMSVHQMSLTSYPELLRYNVTGYRNTGGQYGLGSGFMVAPQPATIPVPFVPDAFDDYRVTLQQEISRDPLQIAASSSFGALPAAMEVWSTVFDIRYATPNESLVLTGQDVDDLVLGWVGNDDGNLHWSAVVPVPSTPSTLPDLPDFMAALYPDVVRQNFELFSLSARSLAAGMGADGNSLTVAREFVEFTDLYEPVSGKSGHAPWVAPGSIVITCEER